MNTENINYIEQLNKRGNNFNELINKCKKLEEHSWAMAVMLEIQLNLDDSVSKDDTDRKINDQAKDAIEIFNNNEKTFLLLVKTLQIFSTLVSQKNTNSMSELTSQTLKDVNYLRGKLEEGWEISQELEALIGNIDFEKIRDQLNLLSCEAAVDYVHSKFITRAINKFVKEKDQEVYETIISEFNNRRDLDDIIRDLIILKDCYQELEENDFADDEIKLHGKIRSVQDTQDLILDIITSCIDYFENNESGIANSSFYKLRSFARKYS